MKAQGCCGRRVKSRLPCLVLTLSHQSGSSSRGGFQGCQGAAHQGGETGGRRGASWRACSTLSRLHCTGAQGKCAGMPPSKRALCAALLARVLPAKLLACQRRRPRIVEIGVVGIGVAPRKTAARAHQGAGRAQGGCKPRQCAVQHGKHGPSPPRAPPPLPDHCGKVLPRHPHHHCAPCAICSKDSSKAAAAEACSGSHPPRKPGTTPLQQQWGRGRQEQAAGRGCRGSRGMRPVQAGGCRRAQRFHLELHLQAAVRR